MSRSEPPLTWSAWLRYWSVVIAWMAVVSYLSTDAFSAENTNRYMDPFLRWLIPGIDTRGLLFLHTVIRKSAHFSEFFVLSLLAFWAFRSGRGDWAAGWMIKALLLSVIYAGLDETHQAFTSNRTPSPYDSGIDIAGAAAAQVAIYAHYLVHRTSR